MMDDDAGLGFSLFGDWHLGIISMFFLEYN